MKIKIAALFIIAAISGCATAPMTFEERLNSKKSEKRPYGASVSEYKRSRYAWHQAVNALLSFEQGSSTNVKTSVSPLSEIGMSDLIVTDLLAGNEGFGASLLLSLLFNEKLSNLSTQKVTIPSVSYYKFIPDGSSSSLSDEFQSTVHLFELLYNIKGNCKPKNWSDQHGYASSSVFHKKNEYYHIQYECPDLIDSRYKAIRPLELAVYKNPVKGYQSVAALEYTCDSHPYSNSLSTYNSLCPIELIQNESDQARQHLNDGKWIRAAVFESPDQKGQFYVEYSYLGKRLITKAYPL